MKIFILSFIISLITYLLAPAEYSYIYCCFCTLLFCISSAYFIKKVTVNNNYINFHVIFLIGNFFIDFAYPTLIYPIDPYFFSIFSSYPVDEKYICQGTGLCLVAMNAYMLGGYLCQNRNRNQIIEQIQINKKLNCSSLLFIKILCFSITLLAVILMARNIGSGYGDAEINFQSVFLITLIIPIILVFTNLHNKDKVKNNLKKFFQINIIPLFCIILYSYISLAIGSRFSVIQLFLMLICIIPLYVYRIKVKSIIFIGIVGVLFMSYIQIRRLYYDNPKEASISKIFEQNENQTSNISPLWNNALDLIINTRNIYKGLEYTEKYGYNYGKGIFFVQLWSPLPFMPSIMCKLFLGINPVDLSSQQILTNFTRDDAPDLSYELGSQVVINHYMDFGVLGVIIIFYLVGYFIQYLEINKYKNLYIQVIYIIMFSDSLFMVRSGLLDPFRTIVWAIAIIWFTLKIKDNLVKKGSNVSDYR